jgi:hypothetical protein
MSKARRAAGDVVACLELLVDVAEQILKGQEPWAEVAVAQLTQYLVDARELLDDTPAPVKVTSVGAFHFGEKLEPPLEARRERLRSRRETYQRLAAAYQQLVAEIEMRLETEV